MSTSYPDLDAILASSRRSKWEYLPLAGALIAFLFVSCTCAFIVGMRFASPLPSVSPASVTVPPTVSVVVRSVAPTPDFGTIGPGAGIGNGDVPHFTPPTAPTAPLPGGRGRPSTGSK